MSTHTCKGPVPSGFVGQGEVLDSIPLHGGDTTEQEAEE